LVVINVSTSITTILFVLKFYDYYENRFKKGVESHDDKLVRLMTENRDLRDENAKVKRQRDDDVSLLVDEIERLRAEVGGRLYKEREEHEKAYLSESQVEVT
jgi:hypothetical protein